MVSNPESLHIKKKNPRNHFRNSELIHGLLGKFPYISNFRAVD